MGDEAAGPGMDGTVLMDLPSDSAAPESLDLPPELPPQDLGPPPEETRLVAPRDDPAPEALNTTPTPSPPALAPEPKPIETNGAATAQPTDRAKNQAQDAAATRKSSTKPKPDAQPRAKRSQAAPPQPSDSTQTQGATPPSTRDGGGSYRGLVIGFLLLAVVGAASGLLLAQRQRAAKPAPHPTPTNKPAAAPATETPAVTPRPKKTAKAAAVKPPATARVITAPSATSQPAAAPTKTADLAACVSQLVPLGQGTGSAELDFVCTDASARDAARTMSILIATSAEAAPETKRRWAGLGWFQMAAVQLMRSRCCGDVAVLAEPAHLASCKLGDALGAIAGSAAKGSAGLEDASKLYLTATDCIFKANTAQYFGQRRRPNGSQMTQFNKLAGGM